jgi:thioredoxin reductase (NADPH)
MPEQDLRAVAFPTLSDTQIAQLAGCAGASLQTYRAGQKLFEVGDRDFKFFVIKSGEVEILDESGETPKTVTVHRPGEGAMAVQFVHEYLKAM